jgi:hypothetical protein
LAGTSFFGCAMTLKDPKVLPLCRLCFVLGCHYILPSGFGPYSIPLLGHSQPIQALLYLIQNFVCKDMLDHQFSFFVKFNNGQ